MLDRRIVVNAAIVAVGLSVVVALAPPAAFGCSGTRLAPVGGPEDVGAADAVFTGTVVRRTEPLTFGMETGFELVGWTLIVDSVEKGAIERRVTVETPRHSASCGVEFRFGQRYRVFADASSPLTFQVMMGDVIQVEPLADPPPTEAGGINFVTWQAAALGWVPLVAVSLAWRVWRHRKWSLTDRSDQA